MVNEEKINKLLEEFEVVGLRYCSEKPEPGAVSYDWDDGIIDWDSPLEGISAIDTKEDDADDLIRAYSYLGDLYLVAGDKIMYGEDEGEVIIDVKYSEKI